MNDKKTETYWESMLNRCTVCRSCKRIALIVTTSKKTQYVLKMQEIQSKKRENFVIVSNLVESSTANIFGISKKLTLL